MIRIAAITLASGSAIIESEETNRKTHKQMFHGIVLGFSGDFVFVHFSPVRNDPQKKTHTFLGTHPVPGQSPQICLCLRMILPN